MSVFDELQALTEEEADFFIDCWDDLYSFDGAALMFEGEKAFVKRIRDLIQEVKRAHTGSE